MKIKNLSADHLYSLTRGHFERVKEHRKGQANIKITLADALMSGLAIFALKKPSLLAFEKTIRKDTSLGQSLRNLFRIETPASDTQLRDILDPVSPENMRRPFRKIFAELQRGNILKSFRYLDQGYLIGMDGSDYFSSSKIKCDHCIERKHRSGEKTYRHQLLGASLIHPHFKQVIPFCPEAISNKDGESKQDCELQAGKRWVEKFRLEHPKLDGVILADALFASAPFIKLLREKNLHYIIGIRPDRHKALYQQFEINREHGLTKELVVTSTIGEKVKKNVTETFNFINGLSLNASNPDIKVNMLEYTERVEYANPKDDKKGVGTKIKKFVWVTDIKLTKENVTKVMRSGRARWKMENETFRTLKAETNYSLEHSYGHGKKNLCTIFGLLAMLAFLIDQAQEIACPLFRKALYGAEADGVKRRLWETFRSAVKWFVLDTWDTLLKVSAGILEPKVTLEPADSS